MNTRLPANPASAPTTAPAPNPMASAPGCPHGRNGCAQRFHEVQRVVQPPGPAATGRVETLLSYRQYIGLAYGYIGVALTAVEVQWS